MPSSRRSRLQHRRRTNAEQGNIFPIQEQRLSVIVLLQNMSDQFVFEHIDWQPVLFGNKDFVQLMKKWNLDEFVTLKRLMLCRNLAFWHSFVTCCRFSYDAYFDAASGDASSFLSQCLSSASVQQHLRCSSGKVSWSASGAAGTVKAERLSCTITSMEFFDRLTTGGVLKQNGRFVVSSKCFASMRCASCLDIDPFCSITKCRDEFAEVQH